MLSNFLITLFSFIGDVIDCNLHFSNGGNCLTILPENVDTIEGAKAFVNTKLEALRTTLALPATTGSTKGLDPRYDIGLNTALSTPLNPNLALVFTNGARPYLYPSCKALPTIGKPPPTSAPSYPYFILFLILNLLPMVVILWVNHLNFFGFLKINQHDLNNVFVKQEMLSFYCVDFQNL